MSQKIEISASIVLFNEDINTLLETVDCFLKTPISKKLFLIDNSPTDILQEHFLSQEIEYVHVGENMGFGRAHNLVLDKIKRLSKFHLILNPDVTFESNVIPKMIDGLVSNAEVSIISPKVVYPNGEIQFTCRKNPTIRGLVYRKLALFKEYTEKREYRNQDLSISFCPEFVHGCFMLFKTQDFLSTNGFDERYFLYMEDADICREQYHRGKKVLYFPEATIKHIYKKGSSRKLRLFFNHLNSALKYFKKWGF